jgi:tripartite-type tricarboxylate transporter receptor subunit TctC
MIGTVGIAASARAADADFYKGKTVTYVVATAPGGGYDFYGRLVAQAMQKQLPGSTFVVKNVPGAGHILGANMIYGSRADGLTIGTFNTGLIYGQIAEQPGVHFDLAKMSWIGKAGSDPRIVVVGTQTPFKSFVDIRNAKEPVVFSIGGVGSAAYVETTLITRAFDLKIKIVPGYVGGETEMAIRRGEIQANLGSMSSYDAFVANGYGRYVLQIGGTPLPGVDQAEAMPLEGDAKALITFVAAQAEITRFTAGPPAIPADRLAALRKAFDTALTDPEFQAQALKGGRPIEPGDGEAVTKRIRQALDQPPAIRAYLKEVSATIK